MSLLPKEDLESCLRNEGLAQSNNIIFTDVDALNEYNEKLLNSFIDYLNYQHRQNKNVFHCGAHIQITNKQNFIKDFINKITIKDVKGGDV